MFRHTLLLIVGLASTGPLAASANEPPNTHLAEIDQTVALALKSNRELQAAAYAIEIARGLHLQSGLLPNPELTGAYANDFAFSDEGERSHTLAISQSFPLAQRLRKAKAVTEIDIQLAEAEYEIAQWNLAHHIRQRVIEIQRLNSQIELETELLAINQDLLAFLQSRQQNGEVSALDANQVALRLRADTQKLKALSVERHHQVETLAIEMGIELPHEFSLASPLPPPASSQLPSPSRSYQERPDYRLASLALKSAAAKTDLLRSSKWGDLTLSLTYEEAASIDLPIGKSTERSLGLGFSLPLPLRDKQQGALQASLASQAQANALLHAVGARILSEIEIAQHALEEHARLAQEYRSQVLELAEENLRSTQTAYYNGQVSLTEVLRAQESQTSLKFEYIEMLHDYHLAVAQLQRAL